MPRPSTVVVLGIAAFGVASVAGGFPGFGGSLTAEASPTVGGDAVVASPAGSLSLSSEDAGFMNRIYGSANDEVVYCGDVAGGRIAVTLAEMVSRGEDYASYDAGSCDGAGALANVHTHPGGAATLSAPDLALLRSPHYRYVCVQHGAIQDDGDGLACYTEADGEVVAVDVTVAG